MVIFGLVFLVYFLNLWEIDFGITSETQKMLLIKQQFNKTRKCQLDLEFLYKCKENKVNPEFVRKFAFIISICYLFKVKPITSKQCSAARCFQVGVLL